MNLCKNCKHIRKGRNPLHPVCAKSIIRKMSSVNGLHVKMERCVHANPHGDCPAFEERLLSKVKGWFK